MPALRTVVLPGIILLVLLLGAVACGGQGKEALLHEGLKYSRSGNHRGAVVLFKNALEKDPNYVDARYHLADAYLHVGKFDQAEKELLKLSRQLPEDRRVALKLGELYIHTRRVDEAIGAISAVLEKEPENAAALDLLGAGWAMKGDDRKARDFFRRAIEKDPGNTRYRLHLARLYLGCREDALARSLLEDLLTDDAGNSEAAYLLAGLEARRGERDKALKIYNDLAAAKPGEFRATYLAGIIHLESRRLDAAAKSATDLQARFGKRPEGPRLQGLVDYFSQRYDEAEVQLLESLSRQPELSAFYFLGLTYFQQQKFELALSQFQKAIDVSPSFVKAREMVAMTLLKQKRLDDAVNEARKALELGDDNALAHNILGSAYLAKGNFDDAMQEFDRAIAIDPGLADARLKKGLYRLSQGDPEKAEQELLGALNAAPEAMNTRLLLCSLYLRQQNYEAALKALEDGLTGGPEDALLYNYMAAAHFGRQENEPALAALEKAKAASPGYFTPYFNLAGWYASQRKYDQAIAEYQAILQQDPEQVKALVLVAALYEMTGKGVTAGEYFKRAGATMTPAGSLAYAEYLVRMRRFDEIAPIIDNALATHDSHPGLLEFKGRLLVGQKRLDEAAVVFTKLEGIRPGAGYPLLVEAYLRSGKADSARELAAKVIAENRELPYGYLLLAAVHEAGRDLAAAEKVLDGAPAAAKRKSPMIYMRLAAICERTARGPRALELYRQVAEAFPRYAMAEFAIGSHYERLGNQAEAVKYYESALLDDPNHIPALNNLAYLYAGNYSNREKALDLALRAYRSRPNEPAIIDTLGYILLQNERLPEARRLLEKAHGMLPKNPSIAVHLALTLEKLGETEKTVELLRQALENEQFPEADAARKLLLRLTNAKRG
ncbi:MAG: PEP-CTERM system TPR-repeat protein PrsT [Deltaproteobacteria bacterium]|nr:PEP-CTERM system TPR-repeat protein PrsT [Candidatus Anaeroferrophillacea bacterium]